MHLEKRKMKEIEHSDRRRRSIVRAYEYHTDASSDQLDEKDLRREVSLNSISAT